MHQYHPLPVPLQKEESRVRKAGLCIPRTAQASPVCNPSEDGGSLSTVECNTQEMKQDRAEQGP